ncbi:MAG TPA: kelch repeat-containing protein [Pyrinomonadaceae bacterium]|nr:kelch repeat-containing protein [Pyrinomonadaceae bacterium]
MNKHERSARRDVSWLLASIVFIATAMLALNPALLISSRAASQSYGNLNARATACTPGDLYGVSPNGTLSIINQTDGTGKVVGTPSPSAALSGIAFDSNGRLFGSTVAGTSTLIQIDPDNGALISTIGPIKVNGIAISIGDLSVQPDSDVLFGVRSNADGFQGGGELYTIDVNSAAAKYVGNTGAGASGGLAFATHDTLYQAAHNSNFDFRSLNTIDPVDAHRLRTVNLSRYYDGLGRRPSDGLLFATVGGSDTIYSIDSETGAESLIGSTGLGVSDLDFRRICGSATPTPTPTATPTAIPTPTATPTPAASPSWTITGNLNSGRDSQTATLLTNGKVLVTGGNDSNGTLKSAELYDPATGTWSITGNLKTSRAFHTATLLPNGKVLVAGGFSCAPPPQTCSDLNGAELYDPSTGNWSDTGNLNHTLSSHTATLLLNGKVLVAGGFGDTAELYDPASGSWSNTGSLNLNSNLIHHTATLLSSGKILLAGGLLCGGMSCGNGTNMAALFDPVSETWSSTGNLNTGRELHTATLLPNGKVLIAGGLIDSESGLATNSVELYEPANGTWSVTGSLNQARAYHTSNLLADGKVLVAGGFFVDNLPNITNLAELYDPVTGSWSNTASLNIARRFHTATLLLNGKVLAAGGTVGNSAELYDAAQPNQIDDEAFFVRQHYLDFLNREPDSSGLDFWINNITSCGFETHCVEVKRIDSSAAFFLSIEFQQTGYLVYRTYKAAYGNLPNAPVPLKFNEFLPDTQQIGQGVVVNQPGWEQVLDNNKQTFFSDFVQRSRFASAYPTSLTPDQFVDQLFMNAGVTPSANDRTAAINEFGSATTTSDVSARARALRRVAENTTLALQEFNRAFVLMQYFGYLRRNPDDAPEPGLNFDGYNFWLTKLNQFNGNFGEAEMVKAFLVSDEYRQRFGP